MVTCMRYCATAVIEQFGPDDLRRAIAGGTHLSTLAFSETGSRSHFWAPMSTATTDGDAVVIDASKSWVTSADEADSYVWTSRPTTGDGPATLWLVPSAAPGQRSALPSTDSAFAATHRAPSRLRPYACQFRLGSAMTGLVSTLRSAWCCLSSKSSTRRAASPS